MYIDCLLFLFYFCCFYHLVFRKKRWQSFFFCGCRLRKCSFSNFIFSGRIFSILYFCLIFHSQFDSFVNCSKMIDTKIYIRYVYLLSFFFGYVILFLLTKKVLLSNVFYNLSCIFFYSRNSFEFGWIKFNLSFFFFGCGELLDENRELLELVSIVYLEFTEIVFEDYMIIKINRYVYCCWKNEDRFVLNCLNVMGIVF